MQPLGARATRQARSKVEQQGRHEVLVRSAGDNIIVAADYHRSTAHDVADATAARRAARSDWSAVLLAAWPAPARRSSFVELE